MSIKKKIAKFVVKGLVIAGLSKVAMVVVKKFNKDGELQNKANDFIDDKAEVLKEKAKMGVSKAVEFAEDPDSEKNIKKVLKGDS